MNTITWARRSQRVGNVGEFHSARRVATLYVTVIISSYDPAVKSTLCVILVDVLMTIVLESR